MCRTKRPCTLLGADPSRWEQYAPLAPPPAASVGFEHFARAVEAAAAGATEQARQALALIDHCALREWYIEHALFSGVQRAAILATDSLPPYTGPLAMPRTPPASVVSKVFQRDGYRCRYCHARVVSRRLLREFQAVMGEDALPLGSTDETTHGAVLCYSAVADHVVPRSRGGLTDPANLVTACYPCNFGKADFTVDQLALQDPRVRPAPDAWNSLERLVPVPKARAQRPPGSGLGPGTQNGS